MDAKNETPLNRLQLLRQMEEKNNSDAFVKYAIALELINAADYSGAAANFEWLLTNQPDYIATYYQYGRLLALLGETERALKIYQFGIEKALLANDTKTANELRAALEEAED
jgi:tetratricopeptide (TPR) repeat protein